MRIQLLPFFFLTIVLLAGCASTSELDLSDIKELTIETRPNSDCAYGSTVKIDVIGKLKKDEQIFLTEHPKLKITSSDITKIKDKTYLIDKHPNSFDDQNCEMIVSIEDERQVVTNVCSFPISNKGTIHVLKSASDGRNGYTHRRSTNTLFGRNGVDGRAGLNGTNGENGANCTAHVWMEGSEVRLRIENDSTGSIWKYKSTACDSIFIDLSGGNGGNGATGSGGGNGKNGKGIGRDASLPGNGGNGGNGGNAGNAGNGGSILIFIHSNAKGLKNKIHVITKAGTVGSEGVGGPAGVSGVPLEGQELGESGIDGEIGNPGKEGVNGPKPVISIINFDYQTL